jgi:RNA polymerase sigma-70 factor (ECF subfamily)
MNQPDAVLVQQARSGDRSAFEELVRRTSRLVFARIYLDTGDAELSEDLMQETFLLAFRSLHRLENIGGFRTWLLTLARNATIDAARRATRQKRLAPALADVPLSAIAGSELSPDELAEREEMRCQVLGLLRGLPEVYRLPVTLRYIAGVDSDAIAEHLGTTQSAVRSLVYRGLKLLRERLPPELKSTLTG